MIPTETIRELEEAYTVAADYAQGFRDAVKAQALKHDLEPTALSRWIKARVNDKLGRLEAEQATLHQLSLRFEQREEAA